MRDSDADFLQPRDSLLGFGAALVLVALQCILLWIVAPLAFLGWPWFFKYTRSLRAFMGWVDWNLTAALVCGPLRGIRGTYSPPWAPGADMNHISHRMLF